MTSAPSYDSLRLPGDPSSAGAARRFLRRLLASWDVEGFEEAATLVLTELVGNAALHAKTDMTVSMTLMADALRLEVADGSPRMPQARNYDLDSTTGRGLRLVAQLSRAWGADPRPTGKVVWCEIPRDVPGDRRPQPDDAADDLDSYPDLLDPPAGQDPAAQLSIAPALPRRLAA